MTAADVTFNGASILPKIAAGQVLPNVTGTTVKTVVSTTVIKGGTIGANGYIDVLLYAKLNTAASSSTKVITVELDGVLLYTGSLAATAVSFQMPVLIHNMGAQNSQSVFTPNYTTPFAGSASAGAVASVDLTTDKNLVISVQLGNTADNITVKTIVKPVYA